MAQTTQEIVDNIETHLQKSSAKNYSDFYIGITNDINRRLFNEHNVPMKDHWRIHKEAVSDKAARAVEKHFLDKGMQGGDGGGDETSVFVYCYEISSTTNE